MQAARRFDLQLFSRLNEEYREKPIVPAPRSCDMPSLLEAAQKRAASLDRRIGVRDKRVLEIGCGRGQVARVLADEFDCDVVGVDVTPYPEWSERADVDYRVHDVSQDDNSVLGRFDAIVSFAVWEHVRHPYAALRATRDLLRPDGRMFLSANLYRGPQASHRYRQVFFPWPHLLFTDDVFEQYYQSRGFEPQRPAWVNKLTYAQYLRYFELLGFDIERVWTTGCQFDEDFYRRFEDRLSRYPRFDLARDFIYAVVAPRRAPNRDAALRASARDEDTEVERRRRVQAEREVASLRAKLDRVHASTSWRMTAPVRWIGDGLRRRPRRGNRQGSR